MKLVFLRFLAYKIFNSMKEVRKFFYQFLNYLKKVRKNYVDGTLRIPIKMFTEAGSLYKMVCQLTNKELILVLTLFEK